MSGDATQLFSPFVYLSRKKQKSIIYRLGLQSISAAYNISNEMNIILGYFIFFGEVSGFSSVRWIKKKFPARIESIIMIVSAHGSVRLLPLSRGSVQ